MKRTRKTFFLVSAFGLIITWLVCLCIDSDPVVFLIGVSILLIPIYFWSMADQVLGFKRHSEIHSSEGFNHLKSIGFQIVEQNQYKGLAGEYRGYLFDVYYDWQGFIGSQNLRAIKYNVYYEFFDLRKKHRLKDLGKPDKFMRGRMYIFRWRPKYMVMSHSVGVKNPEPQALIDALDYIVDALNKNNFNPISKTELEKLRQIKPDHNIPEIEIYWSKEPIKYTYF